MWSQNDMLTKSSEMCQKEKETLEDQKRRAHGTYSKEEQSTTPQHKYPNMTAYMISNTMSMKLLTCSQWPSMRHARGERCNDSEGESHLMNCGQGVRIIILGNNSQ